MSEHDQALASAFDGQAEKFECAPVQSDPAALGRLVREAGLAADSLVLDAGCGPGLVAEAFLNAGHRVFGVDLSSEMIERAQRRCATFGDRARFERLSVSDPSLRGPFDAAVSRYVLHHVSDQPGSSPAKWSCCARAEFSCSATTRPTSTPHDPLSTKNSNAAATKHTLAT
ncbi:class I SAM-dependent methyltransferase [Singulisphaera sp. Ch08]|uniref:Class I SAM-dependent methyltransferase n=1 Tax=Singulisphaera sp. Ch08 TaxID=3120278 RepID=A0AAU7C693_9BACT